jgi:SAM-dependent methyltransferase
MHAADAPRLNSQSTAGSEIVVFVRLRTEPRREGTSDIRTQGRLRAHYEIEVELANRLRGAPPDARRQLYGQVYDELFARVPDHPQLTRRAEPTEQAAYARLQVALIRRFLPPGGRYVEIGAGDCATVCGVAAFARGATAVEVSADIVPVRLPPNVDVAISDGVSVPVAPGSADLVYSNQLMEHLHPDDAMEQLRNIAEALKPGGRYICITPNRLTGPHDISAGFDSEPRGFHLREYTYRELAPAFRRAGFRRVSVLEGAQGRALARLVELLAPASATAARAIERSGQRVVTLPLAPYLLVEQLGASWPGDVSKMRVFCRLLNIRIMAER